MKLLFVLAFAILGTAVNAEKLIGPYTGPVPYIIGGHGVSITQHPHQVSLQNSWGSHSCGGALISATKVVSAAHCTQGNMRGTKVMAGSSDRTRGGVTRNVASVRNHPSFCFSCQGLPNDISVLTLQQPFQFTSSIRTIGLASSDFTGQSCMITGWGRNNVRSNALPTTLLGASIGVISNSDCRRRMGGAINNGHICVWDSANYRGACNGDSGGPLVCSGQLAGVTSWGYACQVQYPSVYSRISYFRNWVLSQ